MQALFGKTFDLLSNMLDFRAARHKVIVSNIANLDTPDYQPRELPFQERLAEAEARGGTVALTRTQKKHFASSASGPGDRFPVRSAGDKVDIDGEMANLAENNLMYNLTAELISRKFKGLQTAIKETK